MPQRGKAPAYFTILYLFMAGSAMLFAVFTVIYFKRFNSPQWVDFKLPPIFFISTLVMLFSSFTIWVAKGCYAHERYENYKNWLGLTLILGLAFLACQCFGWREMITGGIGVTNNVSGAFIYLLSGLHALHILVALGLLMAVFLDALRFNNYVDGFIQSLNPAKVARHKAVITLWHFIDALWLYLFVLFLIRHHY